MYQELNAHGVSVPLEIERSLELVHSYVIVRLHIRMGNHLNAARLLIRIAQSISKFPSRKCRNGTLQTAINTIEFNPETINKTQ